MTAINEVDDLEQTEAVRTLNMVVAAILLSPVIVAAIAYYRLRHGIWLHRVIDDAIQEVLSDP